ncbi:MAG TPA: bifunctional SulP family inorganic anion transporter/carbonic anhydrase [Gammaproteobacteria bacterium]|nr:bifunctional SulP family inorganic anion transporter/carbonic anhydrase [Gammaproteobacteria bacterium]
MVSFLRNQTLYRDLAGLVPEWKRLFSRRYLLDDLLSGTTVACVAIPLSLAIALASNVPPATGLITAIVAGIVCALVGSSNLSVSGPAAAMSVLIASIVQRYGIDNLLFIGLVAGLMQFVSGLLGLGKLSRYVPMPVISGFTAGIGAIILIGQLPRAFGLMPPAQSHVLDVFNHIREYSHEINGACLFIVVATISIIKIWPKFFPRTSPILPAVVISTLITYFANLAVPLIGEIPRTLPPPQLPHATNMSITDLLLNAFSVYFLASLETLLSCSAIDKLTHGKKHNSDQELIGQGIGNIAVSLFGGIPVTGVIVRSATNVRSGAKTRRSSIIHALLILGAVYIFAPIIAHIPIAALAGVLFCVAISMMNYRELKELYQISRSEALVYVITLATIIATDLLVGIQAGIVAACVIFLWKAAKTNLQIANSYEDHVLRYSLIGSLTFLSAGQLNKLEEELQVASKKNIVLLDLSELTSLDSSGASAIIDLLKYCKERNIAFYIKGLAKRFEPFFKVSGAPSKIEDYFLVSEHDLTTKATTIAPKSFHGRLVHGFQRFYMETKEYDKRLFQQIKKSQNPHTLFITCSDSRMVSSQITSVDPGELFTVRNVGNAIPPYDPGNDHSETAAIEFALANFDITDLIVCGHANCGAMNACLHYDDINLSVPLRRWIKGIRSQLDIRPNLSIEQLAQMNVLNQIKNLKTYPIVQEKLKQKTLNIHAWFFDFNQSIMHEWHEDTNQYEALIPVEV